MYYCNCTLGQLSVVETAVRVVGVSPAHDSSIATYCDGKVELFFKEERLSRRKRDKQPFHALRETSNNLKGFVDAVVVTSPTPGENASTLLEASAKILKARQGFNMSHLHHLSHASLAFYNSGFKEAVVIVVDRNGGVLHNVAREAETIYLAKYPNDFTELYKNYWVFNHGADTSPSTNAIFEEEKNKKPHCEIVHSSSYGITKVYETATTLIGQHILENGKTMGLAAYGSSSNFLDLFSEEEGVANDNLFTHEYNSEYKETIALFSKYKKYVTKDITEKNYKIYADYAYQVQYQTQKQVANLIEKAIKLAGVKNICITGGYGLNVVANGYYINTFPDVNFYFEPLADDSGNSIGSAMFMYRELTKDKKIYPINDTFFHGTKHKIQKDVGKSCTIKDVAEKLAQGKSIGIFYGNAEAGPRALGHRSILFDPRRADAKSIVNKIKKREWYRPFAASVLESEADKYFELMGLTRSPFMTVNFKVKEERIDAIPGVVHVDNTCRIQTVDNNDIYLYDLLIEFKKLTGVGMLLNTSLNLAGQPLVERPEEAFDLLHLSSLDFIWMPEVKRIIEKSDLTKEKRI
jgi:carbamoyltransferase